MKKVCLAIILLTVVVSVKSSCKRINDDSDNEISDAQAVQKNWEIWTKYHAKPIASLDSDEFRDLDFLKKAVGQSKIVQLGESGHGVSEFNKIKVRLIKYLHQEMGFNIISFESGLFECYYTNTFQEYREPTKKIKSIFSVWETEEVLELFIYIDQTRGTENPLVLAGFDFQMSGDWTERTKMLSKLASYFDRDFARELFVTDSLFALKKKPNDIDAMREYVSQNEAHLKYIYERLISLLQENRDELVKINSQNPVIPVIALQISNSMLDYIDFWMDEAHEMNIRDKAMATNVKFLKDSLYSGEKMIIWAHNLHIRNRNNQISQPVHDSIKSMGTWLHEWFGEDLYTVGLYMHHGQAAYNDKETYTVADHRANSLESIMHTTGLDISFIDMKHIKNRPGNLWMRREIISKTWGLQDLSFIPKEQYDAILFIDSVTPPVYL